MASWLILGMGVVYCFVSADLFVSGKTGLSIAFFGYAIGNLGLWLSAR